MADVKTSLEAPASKLLGPELIRIVQGGLNARVTLQQLMQDLAFNSPATTKGDLIVQGASGPVRLPAAADGQALFTDSTQPLGVRYVAAPSAAQLADTTDPTKGLGLGGFNYSLTYASMTGGWAHQLDTVKVMWFSSYAVNGDWGLAVQAAVNFVASFTNGGTIEFPYNFHQVWKSGVTVDCAKVGIRGNGAVIDCSAVSGVALTTTNSGNNDLLAPGAGRNKISNMLLIGNATPGGGYASGKTGIYSAAPHIILEGVMCYGFGVGFDIFSSGYAIKYLDCRAIQCGTGLRALGGGFDYGEGITWSRGVIADNLLGWNNAMANGSISFVDAHIDYNVKQGVGANSSVTTSVNSWWECGDMGTGNVAVSLSGGATLNFNGGRIQQNATPTMLLQAAYFDVDATSSVTGRDVFMFNTQNTANVLATGAGSVVFTGTRSYGVNYLPSRISDGATNNRLVDGGFEDAPATTPNPSFSDLWSIIVDSGAISNRLTALGSSISVSTSSPYAGSQCLKYTKGGGGPGDFGVAVPVPAGSLVAFTGRLRVPAGSNGGTCFVNSMAARIEGLNSNGTPNIMKLQTLDTYSIGGSTGLIDWTKFASSMSRRMPSGFTHYVVYLSNNSFGGEIDADDFNVSTM